MVVPIMPMTAVLGDETGCTSGATASFVFCRDGSVDRISRSTLFTYDFGSSSVVQVSVSVGPYLPEEGGKKPSYEGVG